MCAAKIQIIYEMSANNLINYQSFLKFERNLTNNSVEAYISDIKKLQVYAESKGLELEKLSQQEVEEFLFGLRDVGISATSQKRILVGVRSYYKFLRLEGILQVDPTELIDAPKLGAHLPTVLSLAEVDAMIAATDPSTCDGQRNRAILETLYSCGLRVSELTDLKISNIFENERYIMVYGKGRKQRIVPISDSALREIHNYFHFRYELKFSLLPFGDSEGPYAGSCLDNAFHYCV